MGRTILDPTSELAPGHRPAAPRLRDLDGLIGLVDISKPRGDVFLDRFYSLMSGRGLQGLRFTKPTHTRPAPPDLRHEITTQSMAVIQALAD
jgi:hypothetical protein